jgi:monoamine oxidase
MDRRTALQGHIGLAATSRIAHSAVRPTDPTRTADVIVIGAGFAGLAAAKALRVAGVEPLVIEARDHVGGRTCPGTIGGLTIDLGGMWVGPTQTTLDALAREYGVKTYPQYLTGKSAIELNGKWRSSEGEDYLALLSLPVKLDVMQLVYRLTALSDSINPDSPWSHPKADQFDAMTMRTWLDEHTHTDGAMSFMVSLIRAVFCADPGDLSFLFCLFYLKSGGNLEELTTSKNGAQQRLFVGGVHQLSQRMADQLGERVLLNSPTSDIAHDADGVTVTTVNATFRAKALIIAICGTSCTLWAANSVNAFGEVTKETLGNGVVTNHTYDAVTSWLSAATAEVGGGATLLNQSYTEDEDGNVTQRQNNNLGLTENFFYDADNRLLCATLATYWGLALPLESEGQYSSTL